MSNLVLLVGTNPLPNYIVAKYLYLHAKTELRPEKILLVHTPETENIAQRLRDTLQKELNASINPLHNFSDPFDNTQRTALKKALARLGIIHLNYTGGTKAMGVQVFQVAKELQNESKMDFTYSYLDASRNQLRFNDGYFEPQTSTGGSSDLRQFVNVELDTLKVLHNLEPKDEKSKTEFSELGQWLFKNLVVSDDNASLSTYRDWTNTFERKGRELFPPSDLGTHPWPAMSGFDKFSLLVKAQPDLKFSQGSNFTWGDLPKSNRKQLANYLHGAWFERPIYELLSSGEVKFDPIITEHHFDVKLKHNLSSNKGMQLDTVLLRGYELAVVSITTSEGEDIIKTKAFEVLHRAEQLGGEQAYGVVITLASQDKVDNVRNDLTTSFGTDAKMHLKILSLEKLRKLHDGIISGNFIFEEE